MEYLRVVNLSKYQHYTERNPPWVKLHTDVFTSYDFGHLPDQTKWHALALTLLASKMNNEIPNDPAWIQQRTQSSTRPNIKSLIEIGFLEQIASNTLADCKQNGGTEERREEEKTPEQFKPIEEFLSQSQFLNHPDLRDWPWWEGLANRHSNNDLDVILQLKKMEVWFLSDPRRKKKKLKPFVAGWFEREANGGNGAYRPKSKA